MGPVACRRVSVCSPAATWTSPGREPSANADVVTIGDTRPCSPGHGPSPRIASQVTEAPLLPVRTVNRDRDRLVSRGISGCESSWRWLVPHRAAIAGGCWVMTFTGTHVIAHCQHGA